MNNSPNRDKNKPKYERKTYFKVLTDEELDVLEALAKKAIIESLKSKQSDNKPTTQP